MPENASAQRPARHGREAFFIEGEGLVGNVEAAPQTAPAADPPARAAATAPDFRFSRMGPQGIRLPAALRRKVAAAMAAAGRDPKGRIPAGYTYLGQFVDHDLTFDATTVALGANVSPADLLQGRSPTLDLDSLYGAGPNDPVSAEFYRDDRHLEVGTTVRVGRLRAR